MEIPEDSIAFIAAQTKINGIDLFSSLYRIDAFIKFTHSPFTADVVQKVFKNFKFEEESHCKTCILSMGKRYLVKSCNTV